MLGCGISFVAAKLNPHYGGFSLKINLWIFGPSADNIKMECSVFEKKPSVFPFMCSFYKGTGSADVQVGFVFSLRPGEKRNIGSVGE